MNIEEKIKKMWHDQAEKHKDQAEATTPDRHYKELEMKSIAQYIPKNSHVLDVGCGNGISALYFAKNDSSLTVSGIDYTEKLISYANKNLDKHPSLKEKVDFQVADVMDMSHQADEGYDVVVTERCLINLETFEKQKKAISLIHSKLKKSGKFIMCENTTQGMSKVNELRKSAELYEIPIRWHNVYFDEDQLNPFLESLFTIKEINPFASTYYIASRIFNAKLTPEGEEPSFDSEINKISLALPNIGDFCPVRIYVLEKK